MAEKHFTPLAETGRVNKTGSAVSNRSAFSIRPKDLVISICIFLKTKFPFKRIFNQCISQKREREEESGGPPGCRPCGGRGGAGPAARPLLLPLLVGFGCEGGSARAAGSPRTPGALRRALRKLWVSCLSPKAHCSLLGRAGARERSGPRGRAQGRARGSSRGRAGAGGSGTARPPVVAATRPRSTAPNAAGI